MFRLPNCIFFIAIAFCFFSSCAMKSNNRSSQKDIADPGSSSVVSKYYKLDGTQVVMTDCEKNQVASNQCALNPVFRPFNIFAEILRKNVQTGLIQAKADLEQLELPQRTQRASVAKEAMDRAQAEYDIQYKKLKEIMAAIETEQLSLSTIKKQQEDIQKNVIQIKAELVNAQNRNDTSAIERLKKLFEANNSDLAHLQIVCDQAQDNLAKLKVSRISFEAGSLADAFDLLDQERKKYQSIFDSEIVLTPEIVAARELVKAKNEQIAELEGLLTALKEIGVPNRSDLLSKASQVIIKEMFPSAMNAM